MNLKHKVIAAAGLLLTSLFLVTGCAEEQGPYELNDGENYSVSVKYDANGGTFTTNTSVIVDSYNLSQIGTNDSGASEIALIPPDDPARGSDAFTPVKNGCFLAGWYTQRTETADSEGNVSYTYGGRWDFENDRLTVDPAGTYNSAEPVLTLYAAWVPLFEIDFYSLESGESLGSLAFNPMTDGEVLVPVWDTETGAIEMYNFPEKQGCTFDGAYYDAAGTQPVDTVAVEHPGIVDYETGTAVNASMNLYVAWMEGEWYHIYNVDQFLDNASVSGNYVIHTDLDFTDKIWPTSFMYGSFSGSIQGNGHVFRNIEAVQTNNSKVNAGLFGRLTETASVYDVTFENVTFTIQGGTRVVGTAFGLLCGSISDGAVLQGVDINSGILQIDSDCYFGVDDYSIGLLCGMGDASAVDYSGISCTAVGSDPDRVQITVSGNDVSLEFVSE